MLDKAVYSQGRQHLLVPEGTFILGEVQKVTGLGQKRLALTFHRLIMPDGYSVDLDQFHGLDQSGATGLKGKVNNHYAEIFGASIALGLVAGAAEATNPFSKADKDGHCWPVCTALVGAGIGAVAEGLSELANGQKLNGYKIGAAAAGGALVGAITGPVGDAAEAGLVAKALVQVGASVVGGALETKLNGGTVLSKDGATGALKDAVAGVVGGKVEQAAGKLGATEGAKVIIPLVVNTATDTARRAVTPDSPKSTASPPPQPLLSPKNHQSQQ